MNTFLWRNSGSNNSDIMWLSWDKMCSVKEAGGLGFRKLKDFNVSRLAKQAWRLINNSNPLVTKLMHARYYPEIDLFTAMMGNNPSYVWRSILEIQEVIKKGCRRSIDNGEDTQV